MRSVPEASSAANACCDAPAARGARRAAPGSRSASGDRDLARLPAGQALAPGRLGGRRRPSGPPGGSAAAGCPARRRWRSRRASTRGAPLAGVAGGAPLVAVGERRLVAVVAVGDHHGALGQEATHRRRPRRRRRRAPAGVVPVGVARGRQRRGDRRARELPRQRALAVLVEQEHRRQVRPRRRAAASADPPWVPPGCARGVARCAARSPRGAAARRSPRARAAAVGRREALAQRIEARRSRREAARLRAASARASRRPRRSRWSPRRPTSRVSSRRIALCGSRS